MTEQEQKRRHARKMERTALERYAGLLGKLGSRAEALEVICGVFRTGDIRPAFLEHTFGRQILAETRILSAQTGDDWQEKYPSLFDALQFIRSGERRA